MILLCEAGPLAVHDSKIWRFGVPTVPRCPSTVRARAWECSGACGQSACSVVSWLTVSFLEA